MTWGVGRRCGSDPELLWLWCRPAATAPIRPLAWKPPHAMGVALEKTKQKNQKVTFSLSPAEWHLGNELPGRGSGSESWRAGEVAGPGVAVWGQAVRDGSCLRRVSTAALLGGHQGLAVLCKSSRGLHPPESPLLHRRVQTPCRTSPPGAPHPSAPAELASRPPSQVPPSSCPSSSLLLSPPRVTATRPRPGVFLGPARGGWHARRLCSPALASPPFPSAP